MKKILLLIILMALASLGFSAVSGMVFTYSPGTYVENTTGTALGTATNDDTSFNALNIGFTFTYNGTAYTQFSVSSNGFIAMGTTVSSSYTPLSSGSTNNVIAGIGLDLQGQTGASLTYQTMGAAPDRYLVVQWKNYREYGSTGQLYNFQIKLYETTNKVEIVYGSFTNNAAYTVEVGLRGASNADYNNRTTTTDWTATTAGASNSASCTLNTTVVPPSGTTFAWTVPAIGIPSVNPSPVAFGTTYIGYPKTLSVRLSNGGAADLTIADGNLYLTGGTVFTLGTLPAYPIVITPGNYIDFNMTYIPTAAVADTDVLNINNGRTLYTFNVTGTGAVVQVGEICENPYLATLPLSYEGNTTGFNNDYTSAMFTNPSTYYHGGRDWVAKFTLAEESYLSGSIGDGTGYTYQYAGVTICSQIPSIATPATRLAFAEISTGTANFGPVTLAPGDYYAIVDNWPSPDVYYFLLNLSAVPVPEDPVFTITPPELTWDFGTVSINTPATKQYTITNTGGGTLVIDNVVASGTYYSISVPPADVSLTAGESTTFTVQFLPTVGGGPYAGSVTVSYSTGARTDHVISLTGSCLDPTILYADLPYSTSFEDTWTGTPAAPLVGWKVIDANTDSYTWRRGATYISAHTGSWFAQGMGNTNDWMITPPISTGSTLRLKWWDAVESASYPNSYKVLISTTDNQPASFTTELADITCNWTAWTEHSLTVDNSTGTIYIAFYQYASGATYWDFGIDDFLLEEVPPTPVFTITPPELTWDFGNVVVNTPVTKQYTIQNTGGGTLTINSVVASGTYYSISVPPADLSLTAGESTTFTVQFLPLVAGGPFTGSVTVTYDTGARTDHVISLTGNAFNAISATYTAGNIPTDYNTAVTIASRAVSPGQVQLVVPAGKRIGSIDVQYSMTAVGGGWMSEQRSFMLCTDNNTTEPAVYSGAGTSTGTYAYNRTGLTLANGLEGTVTLQLHAFRTYGSTPVTGTEYNYVNNNTWTVIAYLEDIPTVIAPPILDYPLHEATYLPVEGFNLTWHPDLTTGIQPDRYGVYLADNDLLDNAEYWETTNPYFNPVTEGGLTFTYNQVWYWTVSAIQIDPYTEEPAAEIRRFTIEPIPPEIDVAPASLSETLTHPTPLTSTQTLTITNDGEQTLEFAFSFEETTARANRIIPFDPANIIPRPDAAQFTESSPLPGAGVQANRDVFDLQFAYNCALADGEYGVATDGTYFYTTKWNSTAGSLQIRKYNMNGSYNSEFIVTGANGIRDLAYDGTYFYGAANSTTVYVMDFTAGTLISTITVPVSARAITYDPDEDVLWISNGWLADLRKINKTTGAQIGAALIPAVPSFAGMAYDNMSGTTPTLWGNTQNGTYVNQIVQISMTTGAVLQSFDVTPAILPGLTTDNSAGGIEIVDGLVPGKATLLCMAQNLVFYGLELCDRFSWAAPVPASGTVAGGGSTVIDINFDATDLDIGVYTGILHINNNSDTPVVDVPVTLTVNGTWPAVFNIAPVGPVDFGEVEDMNPVTESFTVTNTGGSAPEPIEIPLNGIYITGTDATSYSVTAAGLPVTLGHNESYTFTVTFTPQGLGVKNATLNVDDGLSARPINTVSLTGTGIPESIGIITGLTANLVGPKDVGLNWSLLPGNTGEPGYIHYDDGTNFTGIGYGEVGVPPYTYDVAIRYESDVLYYYAGMQIETIKFFPTSNSTFTLKVWTGADGTYTPTTEVYSQAVAAVTVNTWNEITLTTPVPITGTEAMWIGYNVVETEIYPAGADAGPAVAGYGDLLGEAGVWSSMYTAYGLNYNWNIQAYVDDTPAPLMTKLSAGIPVVVNPPSKELLRNRPRMSTSGHTNNTTPQRALQYYNVYRNAVQINAAPVYTTTYVDVNVPNGTHNYTVQGVYYSGTTAMSDPASITVNFTPLTLPYSDDLEGAAPPAFIYPSDAWVLGTPAKTYLVGAHSGANALVTRSLTAGYNASENSYVWVAIDTAPLVRDIVVSFWQKFDTETGWDGFELQYSIDNEVTWAKYDPVVGTAPNYHTPTSFFWYNNNIDYSYMTAPSWSGSNSGTIYQDDSNGWILSTTVIPYALFSTAGNLSLRWHFQSDGSVQYEGVAIDDINIYEMPLTLGAPEVTISATDPNVLLEWVPVAGATWYAVYGAADPYGAYTYLGYNTAGLTSFTRPAGDYEFFYVIAGAGALPAAREFRR